MTSEPSCIYGECDGSEIIITADEDGNQRARRCRCAEYHIMKTKLSFANIPPEFDGLTVKSFDIDMYRLECNRELAQNIKRIAIEYVKNFEALKKTGKGLYFYGEAKGSGKTRLTVSIGNALIAQHMAAVKFVTTLNLIEEIKSTWDQAQASGPEKSQSLLIADIKKIDVLILDDFGTERPSSWVNEIFYNILNDRMTANKVTIFTSNCKIEDLRHDSRIINRIMKMAVPVKFPEESVRTTLARQENEKVLNMLLGG